jgi:hypothetical protein
MSNNLSHQKHYHLNFSREDLGTAKPTITLLSGQTVRSRYIEETYLPDSVKKGFFLIDTLQVALLKDIVIIETENLKKRYSKSIKKRRVDDNYFDLSKRSFQVFGYKNEKGELFAILNILPLDTPNMEIYHFSIDGGCKYMQLIFNLTSYKTVVCECNGVS